MRWKYLIGFSILLLAMYLLLFAPPASGSPVTFILPNGFKGVFVLKIDGVNGIVPRENNSVIQIKVPNNGILFIQSRDFLRKFRVTSALYESGISIPNGFLPGTKSDDIALYELGNTGFNGNPAADYFLVGTKSEYDKWTKTGELTQRPDAPKNKTKE